VTVPQVLKACFPQLEPLVRWREQKSYYEIPNLVGETSRLYIYGTDSKERVDKILGTEWSTVFIEEASQVPYTAVSKLITRMRDPSGLSKRLIYAMNPSGTKHWAHQMFAKDLLPTGEPWLKPHASLLMNPTDNLANLEESYLDDLQTLSKRERERFWLGKWANDIEGALWSDHDIVQARAKSYDSEQVTRSVVAVDPSVSDTSGSDECGIVVTSLSEDEEGPFGIVEADYSGKMSTKKWAATAVRAYEEFQCNEIVIEANQGGDLCVDAIKAAPGGKYIKVVKVHAARGKQARAEPVQALYENGRVAHNSDRQEDLSDLEDELTNWVPTGTTASPNRLDAAVWGLTHLMLKNTSKRIYLGSYR
jgi:phage terminase large subunit-like protein